MDEIRQGSAEGEAERTLEPFIKAFENNTSIFTSFSPSFILDKLQGELQTKGVFTMLDDELSEMTFNLTSDTF